MSVLIRTDSSPRIGTGHVMRMLTLADAMDTPCTFVCRHVGDALADRIVARGHGLVRLQSKGVLEARGGTDDYARWLGVSQDMDAHDTVNAAQRLDPLTAVIVDHYGIGEAWERAVARALPDMRICVVDDLNRAHACHSLLDTTYGKDATDYAGRVGAQTELLLGARYALLRPDFAARRGDVLADRDARLARPAEHVLISMGGMDPDNVSERVLDAVAIMARPPARVSVLVGGDAPHRDALRARALDFPVPLTVHAGVSDVASLLADADLCVGAAGSSTWERCCLGLPTLNIVIAENQQTIARELGEAGALVNAGTADALRPADLARQLDSLFHDGARLRQLSLAAREVCRGHGARLVAERWSDPARYRLRDVNADDAKRLFEWQQHPETRRYAVNPEPPRWEEHVAWMTRRLTRGRFYFLCRDDTPVGLVRLDGYDGPALPATIDGTPVHSQDVAEVSILAAPEAYGRGLGTRMLDLLRTAHPDTTIVAHVLSANVASRRLFARCGYHPFAPDYFLQNGRAKTERDQSTD